MKSRGPAALYLRLRRFSVQEKKQKAAPTPFTSLHPPALLALLICRHLDHKVISSDTWRINREHSLEPAPKATNWLFKSTAAN